MKNTCWIWLKFIFFDALERHNHFFWCKTTSLMGRTKKLHSFPFFVKFLYLNGMMCSPGLECKYPTNQVEENWKNAIMTMLTSLWLPLGYHECSCIFKSSVSCVQLFCQDMSLANLLHQWKMYLFSFIFLKSFVE